MRCTLLLFFCTFLSACAAPWMQGGVGWEKKALPIDDIRYVVGHPMLVALECRRILGAEPWGQYEACAVRGDSTCTIYLPENAPQRLVDHEVKHCEGWVHR